MKYIKGWKLINENLDKHFEIGEYILNLLRTQNPIIDDVNDIMIEVSDSWNINVVPYYTIFAENVYYLELKNQKSFSYFDMSESSYEDLDDEYQHSIDFIRNIRNGNYKKIKLVIDYQYANHLNNFESLLPSDEQKKILSEIEERIESIGCKMKYEFVNNTDRLWKVYVEIPVNLKLSKKIDNLDGISNKTIKKIYDFIKSYKIDDIGQEILSEIIREINKK